MELEKSERESDGMTGLQDRLLSWLYGHAAGRILLRPMVAPWFSEMGGRVLDTRLSALAVPFFVKGCGINLTGCEKRRFRSYNDFFTRELKDGKRPVEEAPGTLVSPCDARLCVYPITEEGRVKVKHTSYTAGSLLRNQGLARRYQGGILWLFRLCVEDYHRYIFPDGARVSPPVRIPGVFHTVNPIANDQVPIYKENTREYCVMRTDHFGTVVMMEVGALLVGRIENTCQGPRVERGWEKGHFAFGGSTVILMTQKGRALPDSLFLERSRAGLETKVRQGQRVGIAGVEKLL